MLRLADVPTAMDLRATFAVQSGARREGCTLRQVLQDSPEEPTPPGWLERVRFMVSLPSPAFARSDPANTPSSYVDLSALPYERCEPNRLGEAGVAVPRAQRALHGLQRLSRELVRSLQRA